MPNTLPPSVFRPNSEFAYPFAYDVENDQDLIDAHMWSMAQKGKLVFAPIDALVRWVRSSPGHWQNQQTARYPLSHMQLDDALIPDDQEPHEFKRSVLKVMASVALYGQSPGVATDLHPIGHMVRATVAQDNLLFQGPLSAFDLDPKLQEIIRHALSLHDIAETEHPGVSLMFGSPVGDISATVGKTTEERAKESAIFQALLQDLYADVYSDETREIMIRLVNHSAADDRELSTAHSITELAHNLNTAETGIAMGDAAGEIVSLSPRLTAQANMLSLIAESSIVLLSSKFKTIFDHSPELKPFAGELVALTLNRLHRALHSRDSDEGWIKWRHNKYDMYGSYTPQK